MHLTLNFTFHSKRSYQMLKGSRRDVAELLNTSCQEKKITVANGKKKHIHV